MSDWRDVADYKPRKGPHRMSKSEKSPAQKKWKKEQSRLRQLIWAARSLDEREVSYVFAPYVPIQVIDLGSPKSNHSHQKESRD